MNKLFKLDRNFTKGIPPLKFIEFPLMKFIESSWYRWNLIHQRVTNYIGKALNPNTEIYWIPSSKFIEQSRLLPFLKFIECDATTIDSAKSQQLVVGVFYFLTWHDMDVRRHAFFALELLTLNEKKLSLVSSGESLVLIHELSNLNHPILIINHSVPWLNLTSLGKQSPFPYFMTFDWLQILSRNLNITGKTVQ